MRGYTLVGIEEAKQVWDSLEQPNYRKVVAAFHAVGKEVSVNCVRRWHQKGWVHKGNKQVKSGLVAAMAGIFDKVDTTSVPTTFADPLVRARDLVSVFTKVHANEEAVSELEKRLTPLARTIAKLADAELLVLAHRRIIEATTLGVTLLMQNEAAFTTHAEQCSAALKNYTASVALATDSLKGTVVTLNGELVAPTPETAPVATSDQAVLPAVVDHLGDALRSWREPRV